MTPHGFCLVWDQRLIALHAGSDAVVALSYYSIPLAMAWFVRRRRDLSFGWLLYLFASFILACGTTHWLAILTLWYPAYWLEGMVKLVTAALSLTTAVLLWPLLPTALAVPSPAALQHVNRQLSLRVAENDRAARLLQESEQRYRSIYNQTPVPLHTLDIQGRLNGISDYWCDLLGYDRSQVIGRSLTDFCSPDQATALRHSLEVLLRDGEMRDVACVFRRSNDELLDVLLSARLERDSSGQPLHILGALTDVTGRKQAERALRASEERLQQAQKMEAIGKLTGGIAHDFNNMLTVIDGNLEMLTGRLEEDVPARLLVRSAEQASRRAGTLTAQLLAFSRRQRLDAKPLSAVGVIDGLSSLLSRTVGEQIVLDIDTARAPPWPCLADQNQLEAALLNLVINATHAISGQGRIGITVSSMMLRGAMSSGLVGMGEDSIGPGDYVGIAVSDDGCGMSEEVRRRAAEPFFTTKPIGKGTGLGLSQTYGFVRQSGGGLRIESRAGRGTTVEMLLPRAIAPEPAPARADPPPAPLGRGSETLLVVEDEPDLLFIIAESLRAQGYTAICAADAEAALAALAAEPAIALIFTDIIMPGMNGVSLAEHARRLRPAIPVVFASGYSDEALVEQLPRDAVFLQKPYRMSRVLRLIQAALVTGQLPVG